MSKYPNWLLLLAALDARGTTWADLCERLGWSKKELQWAIASLKGKGCQFHIVSGSIRDGVETHRLLKVDNKSLKEAQAAAEIIKDTRYMRRKEAAKVLRIPPTTLDSWLKRGVMRAKHVGKSQWVRIDNDAKR